jgi:hypothetical protein
MGPIRGHADTVQSVIRSPQTAVHFVTVLEEMPVQETLDGIAELRGLGGGGFGLGGGEFQLGGIVINMVRPAELTSKQLADAAAGRLDGHDIALGLKAAGIEDSTGPGGVGLAGSLLAELSDHAREVLAQQQQQQRLTAVSLPRYELPMIADGMDLAGLYRLATALQDQGAA